MRRIIVVAFLLRDALGSAPAGMGGAVGQVGGDASAAEGPARWGIRIPIRIYSAVCIDSYRRPGVLQGVLDSF